MTKQQTDFALMLVLNEISDDYENFEKIAEEVAKYSGSCGFLPSPSVVACALEELVRRELARQYRLSSTRPVEEIPLARVEDSMTDKFVYFYITEQGRHVLNDDSLWPFDGRGRLRGSQRNEL